MEEYITSILKKIDNIKRLKPVTQNILLNKYAKATGVPKNLLESYMKGDKDALLNEFSRLRTEGKISNEDLYNIVGDKAKEINKILPNNQYKNNKYNDSDSTDDSDSDDNYIDPIKTKIEELKKGDVKKNINDYIIKNNLFSKTERLVVLLDPVLKQILNTEKTKMELKELVKLY
jgi:hypothetical protein